MSFRLTEITSPPEQPITRTEAKQHLKVEESDDDALIDSLIAAATRHAEMFTRRAFVTQVWDMFFDGFPFGRNNFIVPKSPLISLDSIKYLDRADVLQTMPTADFTVDVGETVPARVSLVEAVNRWPDTLAQANAVTVRFTAGYGAKEAVPDTLKAAMKLMIGNWYENRESVIVGSPANVVPDTVEALLWGERIVEAAVCP